MNLTKGQKATLQKMHTDPASYSDENLSAFFAYTDRGVRPDGYYDGTVDAGLVTLLHSFQWLGHREQAWAEMFKEGTLFPHEFEYGCLDCFEAARRADFMAFGYERQIWRLLQGCASPYLTPFGRRN